MNTARHAAKEISPQKALFETSRGQKETNIIPHCLMYTIYITCLNYKPLQVIQCRTRTWPELRPDRLPTVASSCGRGGGGDGDGDVASDAASVHQVREDLLQTVLPSDST